MRSPTNINMDDGYGANENTQPIPPSGWRRSTNSHPYAPVPVVNYQQQRSSTVFRDINNNVGAGYVGHPRPQPQSQYPGPIVNSYKRTPNPSSGDVVTVQAPASTSADQILRKLFLQKNIDLSQTQKLGSGRYSKVVTARFVPTNTTIAIKVINTQKVTSEFKSRFLPREIECWKRLCHPNLVRILGHYEALSYVFLSMEYGSGGDLLSYVQTAGPIPEPKSALWVSQILSGVKHMHELEIAHRDLKLENIIVFSDTSVKISDFGFAKNVNNQLSRTYCGSKSYSAPEILLGEPYSPYKADVWSIGVISYIMVTDCMPFRENQPNKKIVECQKARSYSYPTRLALSDECRYSIDAMMTFRWADRPDVMHSQQLPWLSSLLQPPMPAVNPVTNF